MVPEPSNSFLHLNSLLLVDTLKIHHWNLQLEYRLVLAPLLLTLIYLLQARVSLLRSKEIGYTLVII